MTYSGNAMADRYEAQQDRADVQPGDVCAECGVEFEQDAHGPIAEVETSDGAFCSRECVAKVAFAKDADQPQVKRFGNLMVDLRAMLYDGHADAFIGRCDGQWERDELLEKLEALLERVGAGDDVPGWLK